MRKTRTGPKPFIRSSKHAGALAGRELTLFLLNLIRGGKPLDISQTHTQKQYSRKLYDMQHTGYLTKTPTGYTILKKGERLLSEEDIWSLTIAPQKRWDGRWRMVLYDIPAKKAKQRDAFRLRLKELGLVLYQNSIWVHPYPLEKTISKIAEFYFIDDCVLFAVAEKIKAEEKLKQRFNL